MFDVINCLAAVIAASVGVFQIYWTIWKDLNSRKEEELND